jgi:fructose-specific phosphotransferase system IIC component
MNLSLAPAWSAIGILAVLAVVVGSTLLVVYAVRRGLVHRDLDGTDAAEDAEGTSRAMGMAGVTLLVIGLGLGLATVLAGNPGALPGFGPGNPPTDCAQAWAGCPQPTANPQATPKP